MKKIFKPALMSFLVSSALFALPAQAAEVRTMQKAIDIAENHTGKKAMSAERKGSRKNGYWEVELVGSRGYTTDLHISVKNGRIKNELDDFVVV